MQPETLSRVDERGWIPLHEAAAHENKRMLEVIFSGSEVNRSMTVLNACLFMRGGTNSLIYCVSLNQFSNT